jgi:tRNA threonylcarbamoyladenosine biosynthesis protein TsaE
MQVTTRSVEETHATAKKFVDELEHVRKPHSGSESGLPAATRSSPAPYLQYDLGSATSSRSGTPLSRQRKQVSGHALSSLSKKEATDVHGATLVLLKGDLGAGKTTFVQGILRALGVTGHVTSPTFVLMKKYPLPADVAWHTLVHVDAYRLEGEKEINALRFEEIVRDPNNLIFFEWPERIWATFPSNAQIIQLKFIDEKTREIGW